MHLSTKQEYDDVFGMLRVISKRSSYQVLGPEMSIDISR